MSLSVKATRLKSGRGGLMTPKQQKAHAAIKEDLHVKNDGYEFRIGHDFPHILEYDGPLIMGSFAWVDTVNRIKWIRPQHAYTLHGVQGYVTPSQVSRAYLRFKFGNRKHRMRSSQAVHAVDNRKSAPLFATPTYLGDGIYVDLKAAYWNIVRAVGLSPEYLPDRYLIARDFPDDFPYPDEKLIRNILVSAGLPGRMSRWNGERIVTHKANNPHINLMLFSVVMDVLHGVANDMIRFGAVYVHTDGYIFPSDKVEVAAAVAKSWGLPLGIKDSGPVTINGVGNYEFHSSESTRWRRSYPRFTDRVNPTSPAWLRGRVKIFARNACIPAGFDKLKRE